MPDLKEKRVELILQQLEELPTLPAVATRVLETVSSDQSNVSDVVRLIENDPALTARVLQLVHRADKGVGGEVASLDRAIVLLGFESVRNAILGVSVFQVFAGSKPADGPFNREEFWKHCIAVACCAELLAEAAKVDPSDAFVCGLLHDLGKIALDATLPKSFARVVEAAELLRGNIADLERQVIGLDHMVVGKRLSERWGLPDNIRDCAWLHGQLPDALPPATMSHAALINLVTLSDQLVREQHLGYSGNYSGNIPRRMLLEACKLTSDHVERAMRDLVARIEPRARALGLGQASSSELYQQALTHANQELSRVSQQLSSKNKRLAVRAKFFDALSGFQSELRADAIPAAVMQAIGETAVSVLEATTVGVFSLPPRQEYAEAMLFDESGDAFESTLIDCKKRPGNFPAGEGPVLAVGDELEWLTGAISPRLPHQKRFWIVLTADGECIGGVIWGAEAGESVRLAVQAQELSTLAAGWSLTLRMAQIREESKALAEQLAESNRQLHAVQNELQISKTMVSVGEMAAGAAHEMNNPLAVISGRSQLLASQLSDPKQKHAATLINEQSHRLSEIITELMDFAKPEPPHPAETDAAELLERSMHEAKQLTDPADRTIEVTMGDLPYVKVDAAQVTAALIEVIDNALQATDAAKGTLHVHGAFDPVGGRVVITITDNGCGMDEETLRRAFDPFFSSKPAGRRRGLGLAKALRWVEASGGTIKLESRQGQGTRTIVLLPAIATEENAELRMRTAE